MRARLLFSAVFLGALLVGAPARAEDEATLTTIRALGEEGESLFEKGAYADALDRFIRIDAMIKRHTIGVYIGRCLEKLGKLNEAAERYLTVTRMDFPPDLAGPANAERLKLQQEARAAAEGLRARLLPRIPAVILQVEAPPEARLTIDGQPVSAALFGVKRSIDPGAHTIEARVGAEVVTKSFSLKEAEVLTVPITLHAPAGGPRPGPLPPAGPPGSPPATPPGEVVDSSAGTRRTAGFVGIGLGLAGVAVGAVAGGLAWSKRGQIEQQCGPELRCTQPGDADLVNGYNGRRTASSVGFIAGGVVLATGVVLVITAPAPKRPAAVSLFAGPGSAGLRGTF
jgi:hypothetical protein